MKKLSLITLGLLVFIFCLAQESPVTLYLQNQTLETYQQAVNYLLQLDKEENSGMQAKLNLAYICNLEALRLMELAKADIDNLKPGERFALANLYLEMDKYADAISIYNLLNEATPKWSCPWRHKGEALFKSGKYDAAKKSLEMAIETNKEHYDAYLWYAKTLYELKDYKNALIALETAFDLTEELEDSEYDQVIAEEDINQLYQELLKLTGK
ncbi:MAG TPA: tetratricopeptide repeat protein [Candidatus Cloacimonas sp.]|nr:tetratricopeptide repeat protein [Candidatus Cloacimonas sp.]HPS59689.1 tetratricopeptide repeat protein [Candidatus Cloacimonas sp.]